MSKDKENKGVVPTDKEMEDALDDIHGRKDGIVKSSVKISGYPNVTILNKDVGFEKSVMGIFEKVKNETEKEKK